MIDATVFLGDPGLPAEEDVVPGDPLPVRARPPDRRGGARRPGRAAAGDPHAGRRADQDLLELFASEIAVAIRNAQLFARVEAQNAQLLELDAAKDDFLRGVSHNLQTPLTSIRAYAHQLQTDPPDRRLDIIAEQSERLCRMVRQLLTVTASSPARCIRARGRRTGARVRRAWEALARRGRALQRRRHVAGLAGHRRRRPARPGPVGAPRQRPQVRRALADRTSSIGSTRGAASSRLTITDGGPGVAEARPGAAVPAVRTRPEADGADGGSGLGLYVSRELCRAMDGDLVLEPSVAGRGAAFSVYLPGEPGEEG